MKREELKELLLNIGNHNEKQHDLYTSYISESLSCLRKSDKMDINLKRRAYYSLEFYRNYALTMVKIEREKQRVLIDAKKGNITKESVKGILEEYKEEEIKLLDMAKDTIMDVKKNKGIDYRTFFDDILLAARYSHELVEYSKGELNEEIVKMFIEDFVKKELKVKENSVKR